METAATNVEESKTRLLPFELLLTTCLIRIIFFIFMMVSNGVDNSWFLSLKHSPMIVPASIRLVGDQIVESFGKTEEFTLVIYEDIEGLKVSQ